MKKILIPLIVTLAGIMVSCSEKEEPVESMISGFVTAYTDHEGYVSIIRDDMGNEYQTDGKYSIQLPYYGYSEPDTSYRMVVSLAIGDNGHAHILQGVFVQSSRAPESDAIPDAYKVKDPVQLNAAYIGGGFLNLTMGIKVHKEGSQHDMIYAHKSGSDKLKFIIYHNAHGDLATYTKYVYLSIPLDGYGLQKNDTVFIVTGDGNKDCETKAVYR